MAKDRAVDALRPVSENTSLFGKLRKRRQALEDGDTTGGEAFKPEPTLAEHKQGYTKEKWE